MFGPTIAMLVWAATAVPETAPAYPNAVELYSCRFEEKDDRNFDRWPDAWRRRQGPGYPGYVKMEIEPATTPVGGAAFVIRANGAAAEIATRMLPVDTLHAYVLECWVKTDGLKRDRIRTVLDFVDIEGRQVRSYPSEELRTDGRWEQIRVGPVRVIDDEVAGAVLRFELLSEPPGDLSGRAFLAEARFLQTPRLELRFDQTEQVFFEGEPTVLVADVSGVSILEKKIEFAVEEPISGKTVRGEVPVRLLGAAKSAQAGHSAETGGIAGPQGAWQVGKATWELPSREVGFYRLSAVLSGKQGFEQRAETAFAIIRPAPVPESGTFGWTLPRGMAPLSPAAMRRLLLKSAIRFVKIPIWFSDDARVAEMSDLLDFTEYLMSSGIDTVGMLSDPPTEIRERLRGIGPITAASVFCSEPEIWYPSVENTFLYFGTRADYWQLGTDEGIDFCAVRDLDSRLGRVKERISRFAKHAHLGIAWNWMMPPPRQSAGSPLDFISLSADPPLAETTLRRMLADSRPETSGTLPRRWLALKPISSGAYSTQTRTADLILRMAAAHREGIDRVFIPNPFDADAGLFREDGTPGVLYQPWRTTALLLADTAELGSFELSADVRNVVFASPARTVLLAWSPRSLETSILSGDDLIRVDPWGREEPVPASGEHRLLKTDEVPAFFLGLDPRVAKMCLGFTLEKDSVPSIPEKSFSNAFEFTNSFSPLAVGTIRLKGPPGWKLNGEEHAFQLAAGASFRRRFDLSFPSETVEGPHFITAEIRLTAPARRSFEIRRRITVGEGGQRILLCGVLNENGMLDVFQFICSDRPRPVRYHCQLFAPGRRRLTAEVTSKPYDFVKTVYHLENGRELVGQPIFLQVQEENDPEIHLRRVIVGE